MYEFLNITTKWYIIYYKILIFLIKKKFNIIQISKKIIIKCKNV